MICASCGEATAAGPCSACGQDPLLDGHYRLEAELGRGASGTTFRAIDVRSGVAVAVKEMPLSRAATDKARQLVEREAAVLRQLDHPAIPGFLESRVVGTGRARVVMLVQELVEGQDLSRELAGRRYTVTDALEVARELLDVLTYLHGLSPPIVHRDLKPQNVMRRPDGRLVLLDFGAVRDSLRDLDGSGSTVAGTFGYMAPEQLVGDATPLSDLYALGALLVELLSRTDPQRLLAVGGGLAWEGRVSVPDGVRDLLRDLLTPDPDERRRRLVDTPTVARRVRALLADPGAETRPAVVAAPPPPAARGIVAVMAAVSALAAGFGAFVLVRTEAPTPPPPVAPEAIEVVAPPPAPDVPPVGPSRGDLPPVLGVAGAPVTVVAFSDYQCPFCARADDHWAEVVREREGQVAVYWRDLPLAFHRHARTAAHAARCAAEQDRRPAMHAALLDAQPQLTEELPAALASELRLDTGAFRDCMASGRHGPAIDRDAAAAQELGITGTPTFFVDGERLDGAQPVSAMLAAVDRALARR